MHGRWSVDIILRTYMVQSIFRHTSFAEKHSSLTLIIALVICSVKARLSVLVWGSLDILCRKPITSGKVQLSKSRSLLSIKEVLISLRLTCLKSSMFIMVSSSMVEAVASPLIGPVGLGVIGANSLDILNNLDSSYCVVGR